jgi:hypothetical protein
VVDLLLTDEGNPRSVIFQLRALCDHLEALPAPAGAGLRSQQARVAIATLAELQLADALSLSETDAKGARPALAELLARLAKQLPALSDSLSSSYLNHAVVSRHLGGDLRRPVTALDAARAHEAQARQGDDAEDGSEPLLPGEP